MNEYACRRNCDILQDFLMSFEESRDLPPTVAMLVGDLISALDEHIGDGYSHRIAIDGEGNIDFLNSAPRLD